jgi:hypothetical protein
MGLSCLHGRSMEATGLECTHKAQTILAGRKGRRRVVSSCRRARESNLPLALRRWPQTSLALACGSALRFQATPIQRWHGLVTPHFRPGSTLPAQISAD